jgi:hypothetical protein
VCQCATQSAQPSVVPLWSGAITLAPSTSCRTATFTSTTSIFPKVTPLNPFSFLCRSSAQPPNLRGDSTRVGLHGVNLQMRLAPPPFTHPPPSWLHCAEGAAGGEDEAVRHPSHPPPPRVLLADALHILHLECCWALMSLRALRNWSPLARPQLCLQCSAWHCPRLQRLGV